MKTEQERQEAPAAVAPQPKQFDSRHLDRLESAISQFRYWHHVAPSVYPAGYVESQREAYRVMVMREARATADALEKWGE